MSTLKTGALRGTSGTADSVQLHASNQSVTFPGDVIATKQNGCERIVLEQFFSPCDGSVIATSAGNITLPNVTARQQCTETFVDMTGSSITYTPPSGATQVIYTFSFVGGSDGDNSGILSTAFFVDGTEVTDARGSSRFANANYDRPIDFTWGINIGGSTTAATGRQASWSSGKVLKMQIDEHAASGNAAQVHYTQNWGGSSLNAVRRPCIGITAIG